MRIFVALPLRRWQFSGPAAGFASWNATYAQSYPQPENPVSARLSGGSRGGFDTLVKLSIARVVLDLPLAKSFDFLAQDATADDVGRLVIVLKQSHQGGGHQKVVVKELGLDDYVATVKKYNSKNFFSNSYIFFFLNIELIRNLHFTYGEYMLIIIKQI